jgi:hypothetical protein
MQERTVPRNVKLIESEGNKNEFDLVVGLADELGKSRAYIIELLIRHALLTHQRTYLGNALRRLAEEKPKVSRAGRPRRVRVENIGGTIDE